MSEIDPVKQTRSVLIESLQVLGAFKKGLIIVGGWVPEIAFSGKGHIGSMDVDYAIDPREIPPYVYDTIKNRLLVAGYEQVDAGNVFFRDVGGLNPVKIDLITGLDGEKSQPATPVQGMLVSKLKGVEFALDSWNEVEIHGAFPSGEENTITAKVATIEASILMKSIALGERKKEKDAYDIYFYLLHVTGGPAALARSVLKLPDTPVLREAIDIFRQKFKDEKHIGPCWAARVVAESGGDEAIARTDAAARAAMFLKALNISR